MKKSLKRVLALCLCFATLAGFIPALPAAIEPAIKAEAATAVKYTGYTHLTTVKTQGSASAMQGIDTDGTYLYCAKVNTSTHTEAYVARVHKDTGAITWLSNSATGTTMFTQLAHANDIAYCDVNGTKTLFFATGGAGKGSYSLVRMVLSGTTLTEVAHYDMKINGNSSAMAGCKVVCVDDTNITLILKWGNYIYTAKIPVTGSSSAIEMTSLCTLDFSAVNFGGTIKDISYFVQQGFGYKDNKIFVPMSGNYDGSTINNESTIVCFDIDGASGTIRNDPSMSVWVSSSTYADLFETESCTISPVDGKLYFNTNCRKTSTDGNHDGIFVLDDFVYSASMGDSTTPQNYRWETLTDKFVSVTDGGSVYNSALRQLGTVSGNTLSGARFSLDKPIILKHSEPWVLEWKSANWSSHSLFLSTYDRSGYTNNYYLYRRKANGLIALGYQDGSQYNNYGVMLSDHGIDDSTAHVYRLENRISDDGTNMVYLLVDGTELGAMNNYYVGGTSQGTTSNWVSGKDFAFSYVGTPQHPVGADLTYLQVWSRGNLTSTDEPNNFRWETGDSALSTVEKLGMTSNPVTALGGSCSGGTYSSYYAELNQNVVLLHNRPWVVEWQSDSWSGGCLLLSSGDTSKKYHAPYVYRSGSIVSIGYTDGVNHHNYGIKLADYGIAPAAGHTYRMTNKIAADGSNMVYLTVDGVELGAMNGYFLGSTSQGTTSNWISGKDFSFGNLGTNHHPINQPINYIQVWENGVPAEDTADSYRWEISGSNFNTITTEGYSANQPETLHGTIANGTFTESYFRLEKSVVLLHDRSWSISWQSAGSWEGNTNGAFLFSASINKNQLNAPYLFRRKSSDVIAFGFRNSSSQHENYGIRLSDYGIDGEASHTYQLVNRIAADGSNMVYLYVDDVEIGAMNNQFLGTTAQGVTSNWLSGKDLVFNFMGTPQFTISIVSMDYIEVDEGADRTGTVVFKDWDGTVISSQEYNYGDAVIVPTNPTRPADNQYTYYFAGWDKTVVNCNGDAVYTATYSTTLINYTVTFKDYDGTVLSSSTYHYGDAIIIPANPTRPTDGVNVYSFTGWTPAVTACQGNQTYTAVYTSKEAPTITPGYATVSFEGQIQLNIYYTVKGLEGVPLTDMGLLTWSSAQENGTIEDAYSVVPVAVTDGTNYMVHTNGIPAKNLGNTVYFKVYAKLADGTYVYSKLVSYSPKAYAERQIANGTDSYIRSLCVALLNYGAAAQTYFNYQPYALMNANLTAEQQSWVDSYDESMVDSLVAVNSTKITNFTSTGGFSNFYPSVSFEGAFSVNYYAVPSNAVTEAPVLYYWYAEDYNNVDVLTTVNASGSVTMTYSSETGTYYANVAGIAAKELDKTMYVSVVYHGSTRYCSGVIAYSVGRYLETIAANANSDAQDLAASAAVYGYYAKRYFASLGQ